MNVERINAIFNTRGADAAAAAAWASGEFAWVAKKIESGEWKPRQSQPADPENRVHYTHTQVDRKGDRHLIKVANATGVLHQYVILKKSESGKVVRSQPLGRISLIKARQMLGKVIQHPVPQDHGRATNVPGNGPAKGSSQGKAAPKKKAA